MKLYVKLFWSLTCISACVSQISASDRVFPYSICMYGYVNLTYVCVSICDEQLWVYAWLDMDIYVCEHMFWFVWLHSCILCVFLPACVEAYISVCLRMN